jgi:hypothetical protein
VTFTEPVVDAITSSISGSRFCGSGKAKNGKALMNCGGCLKVNIVRRNVNVHFGKNIRNLARSDSNSFYVYGAPFEKSVPTETREDCNYN